MIRNVLEDYLSRITKERDFDYPLTSLLQAMDFYDIHFTHGNNEIGKDFIAKKVENGFVYQYAIQSKKGNIGQPDLEQIQQQLFLAAISGLSNPQYDRDLPRRVILVTTGRLVGTAGNILQDFNNVLKNEFQKEPIEFWGKDSLIPKLEEYGLAGVYKTTVEGLTGLAQFYLIYSKAIDGNLSEREIEQFSNLWLDKNLEYPKRILRAALEAEIVASKLIENGHFYEAIITYMGFSRVIMKVTYETEDQFVKSIFDEVINQKILPFCEIFFNQVKKEWNKSKKSVIALCIKDSPFPMLQYIIWCARMLEFGSLYFFLSKEKERKKEIIKFLVAFLDKEEGCGHIPSDKYATTMVWITLALIQSGKKAKAKELVKRCAIWLYDRVDLGFGLASFEADEYQETATLIGYPFDFIKVEKNKSSFLATALSDLAAFIGDKKFYSDVVYDFDIGDIAYQYWQFQDTESIFTIGNEECKTFANIPFQPTIKKFEDYEYAAHIKDEPKSLQITENLGSETLILLSILMKDRYFPSMWKQIISGK